MEIKGAKALVVGMAKSGIASVELLLKHGAEVQATDLKPPDRDLAERLEKLGIPLQKQSAQVFEGANLIVLAAPPQVAKLDHAVPLLGPS